MGNVNDREGGGRALDPPPASNVNGQADGRQLGMRATETDRDATSVVTSMSVQRVAIVDPSDVTREPLRNLLLGVRSRSGWGRVRRYEFFLEVIQQSNPDVAVVSSTPTRRRR
jgi:hypothetical protein